MYARLLFYATTLLGKTERDACLLAIGQLLDEWTIYRQFYGLEKAKKARRKETIDDVIPAGLF